MKTRLLANIQWMLQNIKIYLLLSFMYVPDTTKGDSYLELVKWKSLWGASFDSSQCKHLPESCVRKKTGHVSLLYHIT